MHRLSLLDNQFEPALTAAQAEAPVPFEKKDTLSVTDNRTGRLILC